MNNDNEDSTSGNLPSFLSPEGFGSLIQKRNRRPTNVSAVRNLHESLQQLSIPGDVRTSFPECPETTSSFAESQSASTARALSSQSQQTGSNPAELPLQTPFQHDQRTSSARKSLGPVSLHPQSTSNFGENQSATTSGATSSRSQQTCSSPTDTFPLQTRFQYEQTLSAGKFLGSFLQHPQTISDFSKNQSSITGAPSSYSQQTCITPVGALPLQTRFQHDEQTSFAGKSLGSVSQHPLTTLNFGENQPAFISGVPSSHSHQMGSNPADALPLQTLFQHDPPTPSAGKSLGSASQHPRTTESVIKNQSTSISRESENLKGFSLIVSLLHSPSKREAEELASPSKKQKTRTLSCSTELQFASREHGTSIHTRQKTRHFTYPVGTFTSRKEAPDANFSNKEEKQSSPGEQMSASKEQLFSLRPTQQTGLRLILGQPKSSSPESSSKNSFSKDSKALEDTGSEKDVDRFLERLKQFDKFRCVKCRAKFTSQDELLRHESIHFND